MDKPNIDVQHPIWKNIKSWAEDRQKAAREQNDCPGLGVEQTEFLRGRIAAMKELIALGEPRIIENNNQGVSDWL